MKIRHIIRASPQKPIQTPRQVSKTYPNFFGLVSFPRSNRGGAMVYGPAGIALFFCAVEKKLAKKQSVWDEQTPTGTPSNPTENFVESTLPSCQNTTALLKWKNKSRATGLGPHQTPQEILRRLGGPKKRLEKILRRQTRKKLTWNEETLLKPHQTPREIFRRAR